MSAPANDLAIQLHGYRRQFNRLFFDWYVPEQEWPDLRQDVAIEMLKALDRGVLNGDPFNYAYTVAKRMVIDRNRANLRMIRRIGVRKETMALSNDLYDPTSHYPDAFEVLARTERHEAVRKAITDLPHRQRQITTYILSEEPLCDYPDNPSTARARFHGAKKTLRQSLQHLKT